jgi:hypothetical protein
LNICNNNIWLKGIIDQPVRLKVNVKIGAAIKIIELAVLGTIVSLKTNLIPSANACNKP